MTASPRLEMDSHAWKAGFAPGLGGDKKCPYPETDATALAWSSGWVEME